MTTRPLSWGRADEVLVLLRANTPESLKEAERILGKRITVCPPCIPPWPPVRVVRPAVPKVSFKSDENPHEPTSDAFARYAAVRVGMTKDQLSRRGVLARDIRHWIKIGFIRFNQ